jgi:hypothetical protein
MTPFELKKRLFHVSKAQVHQALLHDANGDWESAHNCAQDDHSELGSWMHAYLHRKEGDIGNARYWYSQAGCSVFPGTLEEEWIALAQACVAE